MIKEIHFCKVCGTSYGVELHHRIYRSECKPLENCKLNHVYLCNKHHRDHKVGVHFNKKFDNEIKLEFQNWLEILWNKPYLTREEINEVLEIADKPLNKLLKPLTLQKGKYVREEVIRQCMGGKLVIEEGVNNEGYKNQILGC
ncbi:hypothetical protein [Clostridium tertium]|uniref:hypothetical protein n=1 Tax=Clostridium tertium TaxID=1559 RepID=UPI0020286B68|nr:hypothetical protein [Clostridium tertium]